MFYCTQLFMKYSLGIFKFHEKIFSLSHYIFSLYFFALISEEDFLFPPCYFLELSIQMGTSFLFSLPLASLLFSAIYKPLSDNHFSFLHFFFLGMVLINASCKMSGNSSTVLQALLSDLIPESICHFHCDIEPGSPALQVDYLPTELSGKPHEPYF